MQHLIDKQATFSIIITFLYILTIVAFISIVTYTNHIDSHIYQANTPKKWQLIDANSLKRYRPEALTKWQNIPYTDVTIPVNKNINLSGWLTIIDEHKPVIIVVHGISPNSKAREETVLLHNIIAKAQLNVLSIDLRNYGNSSKTGYFIKLGQDEYQDVIAAAKWLRQHKKFTAKQIGVAGLSLGAVTSAIAFSRDPNISAIWLDSPFTSFSSIVAHELSRYGLAYHDFIKKSIHIIANKLFGFDPSKRSAIDAITHAKNRGIFITQGTLDQRIPLTHAQHFIAIAKSKNVNVESWFTDGYDHLDTLFKQPELYQKKIADFFLKYLETTPSLPQTAD